MAIDARDPAAELEANLKLGIAHEQARSHARTLAGKLLKNMGGSGVGASGGQGEAGKAFGLLGRHPLTVLRPLSPPPHATHERNAGPQAGHTAGAIRYHERHRELALSAGDEEAASQANYNLVRVYQQHAEEREVRVAV